MNQFTFDKHWDAIKGQLKQRYGQLTDDDLAFVEGKGEELLARLREKLGLSAEDLTRQLNELHAAVGGRFEDVKNKAAEIAGEVRGKARAAADDLKARAANVADDLKARAATAADDAKTQAGVAYDQARQRARTLWEDGEEYVRQNPRESIVAAVLAGFVAGMLIKR